MKKEFTLLQLFSIADGRLSTEIGDVYDMLNHICDTSLMTHHLPTAFNYLKKKNPEWLKEVRTKISDMGITKETDFKQAIDIIEKDNPIYHIPQLKDEVDTSDFGDFMVGNSLLLRK